ncbi:MAG: HDOD domain-containing protein [Rhodospirillales bacterium]|nr:MAG: HDOD domain-containing protein [Rhodospirillales bacterium]
MRPRILFVDDDPRVQQGLGRTLRYMRERWDMAFADGPETAINALAQGPFEVVVTDMRMAGMDGADLLGWVRERHPEVVRIILSGYSDKEAVFRTVGPAHQYLAKPCEHEVLIQTIDRALTLRRKVASEEVRSLVAGVETLPSPPAHFAELIQALDSPTSSAASIAAIMSRDVAMVAQTLKLTNSAYFGLPVKVDSLMHAVQLLGVETIRNLALVVGFFRDYVGDADTLGRMNTLSRRSLSIGELAAAIARQEGLPGSVTRQAEAAGVLSHVGTLLLMARWPERFGRAIELLEREGLGVADAEFRVFGSTHAEIGAYLLGLWGFTDPIVEAVAYHHSPSEHGSGELGPVALVHAAQYLCRVRSFDPSELDVPTSMLDVGYLTRLGVLDRLARWAAIKQDLRGGGQ